MKEIPLLPDKAIAVGDTWTEEQTKESPAGPVGGKMTFKVTSITDEEVKATMAGGANMNNPNMPLKTDIKGYVVYDRQTGWIQNSRVVVDMSLDIAAGQQKRSTKIKITGIFKVID